MNTKTRALIAAAAFALAVPAAALAQPYDPNQAGSYYEIPEHPAPPAPRYAPPPPLPAYEPAYYGPSERELRQEERREWRRMERLRRLEWERRHAWRDDRYARDYDWR